MNRILLVDDHLSFRQVLAIVLERQPGFAVVAQAGSVAEAHAVSTNIDTAIIDLKLPDGSGIDVIRALRRRAPHVKMLVLTGDTDTCDHGAAVEAGAAGILEKTVSIPRLIDAVQCLAAGESLLAPGEATRLLRLATHRRFSEQEARATAAQLTAREREVLVLLAQGLTSNEIAQRLAMTVDTEHAHMLNIFRKFEVHSRVHALVVAIHCGAVTIPESRERLGA